MRLSEMEFPEGTPVDGYGPGFVRVGGQVHRGRVLVLPSGVQPWGGWDDRDALLAAAASVDVLLVGTGAAMTVLPVAFRAALEAAGIALEPMSTPSACRTYNVLLAEGRRVGLALIPV
ncbi:hypothetical protein ruthe_00602 [Rubellimicrobium thermophilum DSM 16684]|uniref:Mth938-like domain-containing protein n=1 Tax=Rubellimicrobium thermophilum DSM 16684 TaxID=1123069 RepID=S9SAP0_9RHOB|nr:Mth938-like domain-containing protein [Rubellimicrobium thermophilum]EPX87205.1 hypothetical protein ruthe_00602 [Rubellimicrobium thermophilum DSM 16684]